jgi:hypothetical protein
MSQPLFPRDHQPLPLGPESRRRPSAPMLAMDTRPAAPAPRWMSIYPSDSPESRRGIPVRLGR